MNKTATTWRIIESGIIAILRSPTGAKLLDAAKAIVAGAGAITRCYIRTRR